LQPQLQKEEVIANIEARLFEAPRLHQMNSFFTLTTTTFLKHSSEIKNNSVWQRVKYRKSQSQSLQNRHTNQTMRNENMHKQSKDI